MKSFRWISLTLLVFAVAGFALAQNADKNTAAPTRNDYRLRVVQPTEGATITGHNVQVVVDTEIPAERDQPHDINSMPHPFVDVFLDDLFQGTMKGDENVVNVANVAPGPHTIVLLAKNVSGEIIDREVMHIVTVLPPKPIVEQPVAPAPAYVPRPRLRRPRWSRPLRCPWSRSSRQPVRPIRSWRSPAWFSWLEASPFGASFEGLLRGAAGLPTAAPPSCRQHPHRGWRRAALPARIARRHRHEGPVGHDPGGTGPGFIPVSPRRAPRGRATPGTSRGPETRDRPGRLRGNHRVDPPKGARTSLFDPLARLPDRAGNCVIAGHRDSFFRRLAKARKDDVVRWHGPSGTSTYRLEKRRIVRPEDLSVIGPASDSRLTLITCFPFDWTGSAPYRLAWSAVPVGLAPSIRAQLRAR